MIEVFVVSLVIFALLFVAWFVVSLFIDHWPFIPRVKRSIPRRSPHRYPVGSTLTLRDGRTFVVAEEEREISIPMSEDPYDFYEASKYTRAVKVWKRT